MRRQRGQQHDAAALVQDRQHLLHQKERRADIHCEQPVKILNRRLLDSGCLGDARIGHQDIKPVTDDGADLTRQLVRAVGRGEIGAGGVGPAAELADFGGDRLGFLGAGGIMHQHLCAGSGERQRGGAADAARSAGDERRFSHEVGHWSSPCVAKR